MFHVVQIKFWGTHQGYELWLNNKPVVQLKDNLYLKRHEAYRLARNWNET